MVIVASVTVAHKKLTYEKLQEKLAEAAKAKNLEGFDEYAVTIVGKEIEDPSLTIGY